jgi:hypothetical protein
VAWVTADHNGPAALATRIFKTILCGGLLTIIGLVAAVAVLVVQQQSAGSHDAPPSSSSKRYVGSHTMAGSLPTAGF